MYRRAILIADIVGSRQIALGISLSTVLKSLIIHESCSCAVAICRSIIGTQSRYLRSVSV